MSFESADLLARKLYDAGFSAQDVDDLVGGIQEGFGEALYNGYCMCEVVEDHKDDIVYLPYEEPANVV